MQNRKKRTFTISQKTIRTFALLVVALLAASAILTLGGFKINWEEAWKGLLEL